MIENSVKLVDLISNGYTLNEIEKILNISRNEVYRLINMLKSDGINLNRNYYYDEEIIYNNVQNEKLEKKNSADIITDIDSDNF